METSTQSIGSPSYGRLGLSHLWEAQQSLLRRHWCFHLDKISASTATLLQGLSRFYKPEYQHIPQCAIRSVPDLRSSGPDIRSSNATEDAARSILNLIQQYGQHTTRSTNSRDCGWTERSCFFQKVKEQISRNEPIKMILPAFPWKSINKTDKVNGSLPDLGEVLALARLNRLCKDIKTVYPKGGEITIATDGLVFDDIVGIPEEDTWAYSETLMNIAVEKGFDSIKLLRVMDIIGLSGEHPMNKETYLSLTARSREVLLKQYGMSEVEIRTMIETDHDTLLTYRGFIRFLETDLKHSAVASKACSGSQYRKRVKSIAKGMMIRAESFTKLLQAHCPEYIRLSIHPSSGVTKLSVLLLVQPDDGLPRTPWHCTVAVDINGSYRTVHAKDVRDTHNLIYHKGQPYYYREKSVLWDWSDQDDESVVFEPQYPSGLLVHPRESIESGSALKGIQIDKLRQLAGLYHGPILIAGFANAVEVQRELGEVKVD